MKANPRDLALAVLNEADRAPETLETRLQQALGADPRLDARDRAFAVNLVQGVFRWRGRLDWVIRHMARFPFHRIEAGILNILRLALYQILFLDRVPPSAAVNEAVEQAKANGQEHVTRFVNGLLRNALRSGARIPMPDREADEIGFLATQHSYPPWLVRKWVRELGPEAAERLLEASNRIPRVDIRTNTLMGEREALMARLKVEGLEVEAGLTPEGVRLGPLRRSVQELESFGGGWFQVQDQSAQICSHLLSPRAGERVLDLCAGRGGKSTHLAALMGAEGLVVALDRSHGRLIRLAENAHRMGIRCIQTLAADADRSQSALRAGRFDCILVDAPCSGLGVIRRHPDIKWNKDERRIRELAAGQRRILQGAVPLLKEGGRLLYVTCTVSRQENEEVVGGLQRSNPEVRQEDLRLWAPAWAQGFMDEQGFFRTFPHVHGMDGFFAALFRRRPQH